MTTGLRSPFKLRLLCFLTLGTALGQASALAGDVLVDNGPAGEEFALLNGGEEVFGARIAVLDDFEVPPDISWVIDGLRWRHVWFTMAPGVGTGVELTLWRDAAGEPAEHVFDTLVLTYDEVDTGEEFLGRPVAESTATIAPVTLGPGRYWFEAHIIGPEPNEWLTTEVNGSQAWINEDGFLFPSMNVLGIPRDLSFALLGTEAVIVEADLEDEVPDRNDTEPCTEGPLGPLGGGSCLVDYLPQVQDPIKEVCLIINVWRKDDGTGNYQATPADIQQLHNLVAWTNNIYKNTCNYSDQCPSSGSIGDTKLRFVIDRINFWDDTAAWGSLNLSSLNNKVFAANPAHRRRLNVHLTEAPNGASGYAYKPSLTTTFDQAILLRKVYNGGTLPWHHVITLAHELGHALDLNHIYAGGGASPICNQSNCEFLDDIFCTQNPCPYNYIGGFTWNCDPFANSNCSNNMMSGNASACFFTDLQIAKMHRSLETPTSAQKYLCKEAACHAPWDAPLCEDDQTIRVGVDVCNPTPNNETFSLAATGLPPVGGCSVFGPTSFSFVGGNLVSVPPYSCSTVLVDMGRPAQMQNVYEVGCYNITATRLSDSAVIQCNGSIVDRRDLCPEISDAGDFEVQRVEVCDDRDFPIEVVNETGSDLIPIQVEVFGPGMTPDDGGWSLDGLPPGEPVVRTVKIPPGEGGIIDLNVKSLQYGEDVSDIVVSTDMDGDGVYEPLISVAVQAEFAELCSADLDGSGAVDFGDILAILAAWGNADVPQDLDGSGAVDFGDLLVVLANWGACP